MLFYILFDINCHLVIFGFNAWLSLVSRRASSPICKPKVHCSNVCKGFLRKTHRGPSLSLVTVEKSVLWHCCWLTSGLYKTRTASPKGSLETCGKPGPVWSSLWKNRRVKQKPKVLAASAAFAFITIFCYMIHRAFNEHTIEHFATVCFGTD